MGRRKLGGIEPPRLTGSRRRRRRSFDRPGGKNSPTDGQGKRRSRDREKKRGHRAAKEIRRDRATAVDGIPDGGVNDRSIGPMGKICRLTPFCYRHDGAIG